MSASGQAWCTSPAMNVPCPDSGSMTPSSGPLEVAVQLGVRVRRRRSRSTIVPSSLTSFFTTPSSQGASPHPVSRMATTGRRPGTRRPRAGAGAGRTYATGCRPPNPGGIGSELAGLRVASERVGVVERVGRRGTGCEQWNGLSPSRTGVKTTWSRPTPWPSLTAELGPGLLEERPAVRRPIAWLRGRGHLDAERSRTPKPKPLVRGSSSSSLTVHAEPLGRPQERSRPRRCRPTWRSISRGPTYDRRPRARRPSTGAVAGSSTRPHLVRRAATRREDRGRAACGRSGLGGLRSLGASVLRSRRRV